MDEQLESQRKDLNNNLLALKEHIREESESSPEEVEPMTALTTEVMSQAFKLIKHATALFDEHDTNFMR